MRFPALPAPVRTFCRSAACAGAAVWCAAVVSSATLSAQQPTTGALPLQLMHHTTWGEVEGLPPAVRERVLRSPDGYLWLGGPDGLVRFDGVRFTRLDASTTPALASTAPGGLYPRLIDRDGTMWIAGSDGTLVHYRDGRFHVAVKGRGAGWNALHVVQDQAGRVWTMVAAPHGLHFVSGDSLVPAQLPAWIHRADMAGLIADNKDGVWIGMRDLRVIHVSSRGADAFSPPSTVGMARATPLLQTKNGGVWIFGDGLQVLRDGTWITLRRPDGARILPTKAIEDASGAVWVGTRGHGLLRFVNDTQEEFSERHGLSDAMVATILRDDEENTWILTEAGLDRLRAAPFATVGTAQGLPIESPHWIGADASGALWIRGYTDGTLYRVDGGAVRGRPGPVTTRTVPRPRERGYVPHQPAREGGLWASVPRQWLGRVTPDRLVQAGSDGRPGVGGEYAMLEDRRGGLWVVGIQEGLTRRVAGRVQQIRIPADIAPQPLRLMVEDDDGRIVVSAPADTSLLFFRHDTLVRRLGTAEGMRWPFSNGVADGRDTLWGYDGEDGLIRVTGTSVHHVEDRALGTLLRSTSLSLFPVGDHFFIASTSGIASVARSALHAAADGRAPFPSLTRYSSLDGIRSGRLTSVNRSAVARAPDGRVWFSTPGGLVVFDERYAVPNTVAPQVHIEEVLAGNRQLVLDSLVRVPAGSDLLEIRFTANALRVPQRVRLEFRLDGVDPQWRAADATRRVTYPRLWPREYTFHVRAWNEDGVPALREAALRLRVLPFWFQSWWFYLIAGLASAGVITGAVAYTLRERSRRAAERLAARFEATLSERTRLAGELHDTLLQGFTGITLQLQAIRARTAKEPDIVEPELARVLTIADHTLRDARSMVWDMRAPELKDQDVAAALEQASQQAIAAHVAGGGSAVSLNVTITGVRQRVSPSVETAALRIGREAVTNTLRHAHATHLEISVAFQPSSLGIVVADNGVGFDVAEVHPAKGVGHWGVVGMHERARRAAGTLRVTSVRGAGTTIDLRIPLA